MTSIKPLEGYLVSQARVDEVASPAYDALTPKQRYEYATSHPDNYLNAMRAREEFPPGECPTLEDLLALNSARLQRMIAEGDFIPHAEPCYFIYRLAVDGHTQTGLVAEIPLDEYIEGGVKKHEHTQALKEDDLTAYQRVVRASSSPICLTYPGRSDIDVLMEELTDAPAELDFVAKDGAHQMVWCVDSADGRRRLEEAFGRLPASYLTDGHHRAASAVRFRELERADNPADTGTEPYNFLLVSFFPSDQLRILEYNRCVKGLNGKPLEVVLDEIGRRFEVILLDVASAEEARPRRRGEFVMLYGGQRFRLRVRPELVPDDIVSALDVSILQDQLLEPVLGITDPRTDPRMGYLSGAFDLDALEHQCMADEEIGFAVHPTAIDDLMAVADADRVMPPKSTWFDPKLRSGIFLLLR